MCKDSHCKNPQVKKFEDFASRGTSSLRQEQESAQVEPPNRPSLTVLTTEG